MDFSKIVDQRNTKAAATGKADVTVTLAPGRSKPGPKPKASSKRNDPNWRAATVFLQGPTLEKMKRFLHLRGLLTDPKAQAKLPADQSELLDEAVSKFLDAKLEKLEQQLLNEIRS